MVLVNILLSLLLTVSSPEKQIQVETMEGKTVAFDEEISDLTVLNFWAIWCKPCVQELPILNNLYSKYKDQGVKFLALSVGTDKKLINQFVEKTPIGFKVLIDKQEKLADKFRISVLPTTVLIDKNHNILLKIRGFSKRDLEKLEKLIQEKLNNKN